VAERLEKNATIDTCPPRQKASPGRAQKQHVEKRPRQLVENDLMGYVRMKNFQRLKNESRREKKSAVRRGGMGGELDNGGKKDLR